MYYQPLSLSIFLASSFRIKIIVTLPHQTIFNRLCCWDKKQVLETLFLSPQSFQQSTRTYTCPICQQLDQTLTTMELSQRHQKLLAVVPSQLLIGAMACVGNLYDPETKPNGVINMGTAENRLQGDDMAEKLKQSLAIDKNDLLYGDFTGSPALRGELADVFQRHFLLPDQAGGKTRQILPENISVFNGCGATIELIMQLLVDPGDGVLIATPLYGGFMGDVEQRSGGVIVPVHTEAPSFTLSLEALETAMENHTKKTGKKVTCMIVCHPNNPIGQVYSKEAVHTLAQWAKTKGLWIIFDEIYAMATYRTGGDELEVKITEQEALEHNQLILAKIEENQFVSQPSPLSTTPDEKRFYSSMNLPDELYNHVITIWGFSKDLAANGLRLGVTHCVNENLRKGIFSYCVFTSFSRSLDRMVTNMLKDREWVDQFWLTANQRLDEANQYVVTTLEKENVYIVPSTAGLFIWVDFTKVIKKLTNSDTPTREELEIADDKLFQLFLANGVYVPGSKGFEYGIPGWYRIIFSMPPKLLEEGLARVVKTLQFVNKA